MSIDDDEEDYDDVNELFKSFIYGSLDGMITTFVTVCACAGAGLPSAVVIVLGIAHCLADGLSMGLGDVLSTQADMEYNNSQRWKQKRNLDRDRRRTVQDMVGLYVEKGVSREDAHLVMQTLSQYDRAFLELVMVEEHGMLPQEEEAAAVNAGAVTMISFALVGCVPLLPYFLALIPGLVIGATLQLGLSVAFTSLGLFVLGGMKGKLVDVGHAWYVSSLVMTANGAFAACVGYIVGLAMHDLAADLWSTHNSY